METMISIGKAASDVCAAVAARKAALERILLTDPYLPARRDAEAEYLKLTGDAE